MNEEACIEEMVALRGEVFAYSMGLTKCNAAADDLTQDVMAKAYVSIKRGMYQDQSTMKAWLCRIAYTTFLNGVRRNQALAKIQDSFSTMCQASYEDDPTENIQAQQLMDALQEAFHLERHYQIMILSLLLEYEYKDIAKILGIPKGTVMSSTYRARRVAQAYLITEWQKDRFPLSPTIVEKIEEIQEAEGE